VGSRISGKAKYQVLAVVDASAEQCLLVMFGTRGYATEPGLPFVMKLKSGAEIVRTP
jgi:hypothetical protein